MKANVLRLALLCLAPAAHALDLAALEGALSQQNRELAAAQHAGRAADARLAQRQAESGWSVWAGADAGRVADIVDGNDNRHYNSANLSLGASYPLLGSRDAQRARVDAAADDVERSRLQQQAVRQQTLRELREAYVALWRAEQQQALARAYLAEEADMRRVLALRRQDGLLLASDEGEFLAALADARARRDDGEAQAAALRQRLARLSGIPAAQIVQLAAPRLAVGDTAPAVDTLPEVAAARLAWQASQRQLQRDDNRGLSSSFDLSYREGREDWAPGVPSRELRAGVRIQAPLELGKLRSGLRDEALAELERQRALYDDTLARRTEDIAQAGADYRGAQAAQQAAAARLSASASALHERTLRRALLPGDVQEQRYRARAAYYREASQTLDAWQRRQLAAVRLAALGYPLRESEPAPATLAAPLLDAKTAPARQGYALPVGAYVWDSRTALAAPAATLAAWQRHGLSRVRLGLNAQQIADPALGQRFAALAQAAHAAGVRLELVLGDPDWIEAAGRPALLALLDKLAPLPVAGLTLDLEIEQLPRWQARRGALTDAWLATLRAAAARVDWPLSATFHYRHLEAPDFGRRLADSGVRRADVMAFVTRGERLAAIADSAQRALPLPFDLVASVERELPTSEGFRSRSGLRAASTILAAHGAGTLWIQDWQQLEQLSP